MYISSHAVVVIHNGGAFIEATPNQPTQEEIAKAVTVALGWPSIGEIKHYQKQNQLQIYEATVIINDSHPINLDTVIQTIQKEEK